MLGSVWWAAAALARAAAGQIEYDGSLGDTFTFVVPAGVTLISAVTVGRGNIGGGGLTWANGIIVTPGETITIYMPGYAGIFRGGTSGTRLLSANGASILTVDGGVGGTQLYAPGLVDFGGGTGGRGAANTAGGGAAGYLGNGGNAGAAAPAGSGAGGGGSTTTRPGGGVGLKGRGADGTVNGGPGSGGAPGSGDLGGKYGGGRYRTAGTAGAAGVRIMWGGDRSYPNNAGDV
ncbi:hypothetical protein FHS82_001082 [Pseudochelatococcus lubricantis]|uniref:Uncharacterized protein n=1 Tax=Pseudochelatococcus lubricantis TaxID=1538102 RepID=A0ABX0UWB6_9HYPH|nr:hypothetical protein [Pseudochelatococcus lubricantis]NIJ57256.1 hypothetical protein [Pseudochelatococcus lubricantis]